MNTMNNVSMTSLSPAVIQSLGLSDPQIYQLVHDLLVRHKAGGKILDFGCGLGKFLETLNSEHFPDRVGVDLMPRPTKLGGQYGWIQHDLNVPLPLENNSINVVTSIEVIEHLENPRATAREWFRILQSGGILIMSTPNNHSIRSILSYVFRGHFVSFLEKDYPAHITALTKLDIFRVLKEAGFNEIEFSFVPEGKVPGTGHLSWTTISGGFLKGQLFSDNIVCVARKP